MAKQLSNAGLNVLGPATSTPTNKSGKPNTLYNDPHQKENTGLQIGGGGHLPPRHPAAAKAQGSDPTFGSRVPRRDGYKGTDDSVMSLLGSGSDQGTGSHRRTGSK